ncbi:MAG: leucine-rich repeat domain-containing protein [Bacteroidaceae bacterium]|nr:leucine-rich repeat domain-containing protein [Bacteroidaceae bacterium]
MKKLVSTLAFMAAIAFGAFTLASCGDDDVTTPSTPSEPQTTYEKLRTSVQLEHNPVTNPFFDGKAAEDKAVQDIKNLMGQELEKIDGVINRSGTYYYDDKKQEQVWGAIRTAMDKIVPSIEGMKPNLDGKVTCEVSQDEIGGKSIWIKEFDFTKASSSFTYNGIDYCTISDTEAGVVLKTRNMQGYSAYTGDVVIPETIENGGKTYTITAIGPKAFFHSTITSISLPKTLTTLYTDCFAYTEQLKSITIPGKFKTYKDASNYSTTTGVSTLFNGSGITEVVVEEGVTTLVDCMFRGANALQKVVLPSTVTEIPKSCFSTCKQLADITVNGTITSIAELGMYGTGITDLSVFKFKNAALDNEAFLRCLELKTINIPEGVVSLGNRCFSTCENATTVTIPASVTQMGAIVFTGCKALKDIHVKAEKPANLDETTLDSGDVSNAFTGLDFAAQGITIYVPAASVDAYKAAPVWSRYADYIQGE